MPGNQMMRQAQGAQNRGMMAAPSGANTRMAPNPPDWKMPPPQVPNPPDYRMPPPQVPNPPDYRMPPPMGWTGTGTSPRDIPGVSGQLGPGQSRPVGYGRGMTQLPPGAPFSGPMAPMSGPGAPSVMNPPLGRPDVMSGPGAPNIMNPQMNPNQGPGPTGVNPQMLLQMLMQQGWK